jgi:hypothetical protein
MMEAARGNGRPLPLGDRLMPKERFECIQQSSGTWMVWDNTGGTPAALGGVLLRDQEKQRAEVARDILMRIFRNGLDLSRQ